MHMADALISPAVGGVLWAASAATAVYAARKVAKDKDGKIVPLMGVAGAFIFAVQMINFSIPATGSSGHLGGALLLAILLGPNAAFLTMFSVLGVQALFFADGGLLALGANVFNMGFIPCYFIYPFIYKPLADKFPKFRSGSIIIAALVSSQIGAFGVVVETLLSGISALPFSKFLLLMQPIHLAIGLVEGIVTALVVAYVYRVAPAYINEASPSQTPKFAVTKLVASFAIAAIICGAFVSYFASGSPDGLEWSIEKVTGSTELEGMQAGVAAKLGEIQESASFLPDYSFSEDSFLGKRMGDFGTGVSGIVGAFIVLVLSGATGWLLIKRGRTE